MIETQDGEMEDRFEGNKSHSTQKKLSQCAVDINSKTTLLTCEKDVLVSCLTLDESLNLSSEFSSIKLC